MNTLLQRIDAAVLGLLLLVGMIIMIILGRLVGKFWNREQSEPKGGVGSLFGALFALSGLILAFTFGMSQNRLERVRGVVELEANDLGTAILRADLYPDTIRDAFRVDFKNYLEAVIAFYENAKNFDRVHKAKNDAAMAADKLWSRTAIQSKLPNMFLPSQQMIPALNDMFDIAQRREIVLRSKIPDLIVYMLFICVLAGCFIGGFTSGTIGRSDWIIIGGFVVVTSMVVYATLDLSRPMRGIITDVPGKEAIVELRSLFNEAK
jgi:hypothetical protein